MLASRDTRRGRFGRSRHDTYAVSRVQASIITCATIGASRLYEILFRCKSSLGPCCEHRLWQRDDAPRHRRVLNVTNQRQLVQVSVRPYQRPYAFLNVLYASPYARKTQRASSFHPKLFLSATSKCHRYERQNVSGPYKTRTFTLPLRRVYYSEAHSLEFMAFATEATRWRALVTRDATANGQFVYSVKSTNIYCRPACPGRLARRANVGFYETPLDAEAAGFRACKRCKPNTVIEDPQERAVEKACSLIKEALMEDDSKIFRLQDLATKVGLTPRYFHKIFKDKTGFTPKEYATYKQSRRSSSSTTPVLPTPIESSMPVCGSSRFEFDDMIDYGVDSDGETTHACFAGQSNPALETGAESYVNDADQAWFTEFHMMNDTLPICASVGDWQVDPLATLQNPTMLYDHKSTATVSTFEMDAAALLNCDNISRIIPM